MADNKKNISVQSIQNEVYYHISRYPDHDLELNVINSTAVFNRTWDVADVDKRSIEISFEKYRLSNHSELPSRKNCFYVSRREHVERWLKKLIGRRKCWFKIYEVSLSGDIYWCDDFLFEDNDPDKYWNGCDASDPDAFPEGLFTGNYMAIKEATLEFKRP